MELTISQRFNREKNFFLYEFLLSKSGIQLKNTTENYLRFLQWLGMPTVCRFLAKIHNLKVLS